MTEKENKRAALVARVEAASSDEEIINSDMVSFRSGKAKDLSTKGEHQQRMKCSECGKSYLGQKNSSTCGDKCRQRKSRG